MTLGSGDCSITPAGEEPISVGFWLLDCLSALCLHAFTGKWVGLCERVGFIVETTLGSRRLGSNLRYEDRTRCSVVDLRYWGLFAGCERG